MTTDSNTTVDMDDLDKFEDAFFERKPDENEEIAENEDDTLETEDDTDAEDEDESHTEDEDPDDEDEDEGEDEPEPEEKPKKGKKSAKERIDEITAEKYELKRQLEALQSELKTRSTEVKHEEAPTPLREQLSADAPNPDEVDKDGKPIYQLGEFDPKYIRDLTRFTISEETKSAKEQAQKEAAVAAEQQRQATLAVSWNEKLEKAEENTPDIRESIRDLVDVFKGVEPSYGDYLAVTIMGLDNGPEVMHYLSQNIGEAQKIVSAGPAAATIAIGRIDERLMTKSEEKRNPKKVSAAPTPPNKQNRGQGGKFATPADTDDLDAFEREYFKKPAHPFRGR